ncbi:hypothetical protein K437DRAFT_258263 [Tilletiaria anomala UBC 951]|uniref:H+/nucleoside cotransporter n=1 Tax=Tilletiaria anomala (strain ATCC 24038 / CBS 436.72 / UBC 951) TaxID=1037660 RepID=A0A066VS94_TILAU|nr:uncharacterized protein K437DRAFT_258263 [Tilletiaria anomala UBC 951]KDN41420.1 hypothetical protein K437DRAFT_258263 [Tilletiaria anomala UBC 951]
MSAIVPNLPEEFVAPLPNETRENEPITSEKPQGSARSTNSGAEQEPGKYAAYDVEAGPAGGEKRMHAAGEDDWLEPEIGRPVHNTSSFREKLSILLHSRGAVVVRDFAMIALLLGIWIPSVVREETRHKWVITTFWAWAFILIILFHKSKYIPQRPFVVAIEAVWGTAVSKPFFRIPYNGRLALGWGALLALFLGTAFGVKVTETSTYERRGIALVGIALTYGGLFAISSNHRAVQARTTILGLGLQMILGLLVYKTGAGYSLFNWISAAATDLLEQGQSGGAAFFWSPAFLENHYFFVNTLSSIIFFVALATMLFYIGALGWCIKKFAWFFHKTFAVSGAEAVVAAASPFIGQGENCVLTRPYVAKFTDSEFHQVLVSGFATIAGSVFIAYVQLGFEGRELLLSSIMSIPGSIAASKIVVPETQRPKTMGKVVLNRDDEDDEPSAKSVNVLHSFSNGAWFGVRVAALIFCNVLCLVSLVHTVDGILGWIGQYWGLERGGPYELSLELMGSYLFYPFVFMLGVPGGEVLKVSKLFATKIVANEFVAYSSLSKLREADTNYLTPHSLRIATLLLCGFGNISSAGINIGILSAMAPKRSATIIRLTPSALLTGILVTAMTAAIGGMIA